MITQIGIVAGEIWSYLEKNQNTSEVETLIKNIDKKRDIVLMSLGWLAREGHIVLEGEESNYKISLRK